MDCVIGFTHTYAGAKMSAFEKGSAALYKAMQDFTALHVSVAIFVLVCI